MGAKPTFPTPVPTDYDGLISKITFITVKCSLFNWELSVYNFLLLRT